MKKPHYVVAVTCVGGRLIYDMIVALRDAADYTITVVGIDADPNAAGRLLCDHFVVLPLAEQKPEAWVDAVMELKQGFGVQGLICLSDQEARLAAQKREYFIAQGIHVSVSHWAAVNKMTDKLLLLQSLAEAGLDVGPYLEVNSIEDAQIALKELGYPAQKIVLKPRWGRGSRGVLVCDAARAEFQLFLPDRFCGAGTFEQIRYELDRESMDVKGWLAVPYWDGPVFDVECLAVKGKSILSAARRRQLRNVFSPTSTGHIVDMNPVVLNYAERMCAIWQAEGAVDIDIVLRSNGQPAPFDASARYSGSIGGSYRAGANFLAQLVRVMFNLPLAEYQIRDQTPLRPFITMAPIPDTNTEELL